MAAIHAALDPASPTHIGEMRQVALAGVNRQPACAIYLRPRGEDIHRAFGINVLRIEAGQIAEVVAFLDPRLVSRCGLPAERRFP